MKKIYRIENQKAYTGHGRPYAWGVIVDDTVRVLVYMGGYVRLSPDDELVAQRAKRKKYAGLSKSEILGRLNRGRFISYRYAAKAELSKIAKESGGEVLSGRVEGDEFIVEEN